ncbi:mannosyl-3-phosphoglycerate phosphatase [Roseobacter denitrificans]|uniref:Mannosyl-3-phosphoglycerate phosphatase, putative n=1 Tax=Roseobacter denitrificans (strain ATCC 33942 / OCh 114) TaxID=375451 RepID=Q162A8_ROSDO|nr:HAD-IIB family hydrolase [Roseobacter denitrificans]ABG33185.1 mannosyl-3-phosphoglycerate phosphatase, putative [Roseobacter denitrificans OCh 114]AVL52536.1 mannosyl-3-phosphoglycerate phosphatase [Roseobacter denitrificans]SFG29581.1 mannosyl-3-phosphoglycerate phosphatase [Roseobacter denitrificans OCh 114]
MQDAPPLLVFTDLDGTLIDHDTYEWAAARPALDALSRVSAGVVLASSKTAPEVSALRAQLQLGAWPAIIENGAGVVPAHTHATPDPDAYQQIRAALREIPDALRQHFTGFGDLRPAEIEKLTGLSAKAAAQARERAFSEPGLWGGDDAALVEFKAALRAFGISTREGGRFLTLSHGKNKSDQMARIINHYKPRHTIALGDAPNDVEMLETADFGIVIPNPKGRRLPELKGEAQGHIIRAQQAGPVGWNTAILGLLERLDL